MMSSTVETSAPERLFDLPPEPSLQEAVAVLARLARDLTFMDARILPLFEEARGAEDWYVVHRYDAVNGSYSLQIFIWPPGTKTRIHDHSSWGAFCCMVGSVLEERYARIDDGARSDFARLGKLWRRVWGRENGVSTLLPYEGGIHRIENPGESTAISVHLYGPQTEQLDGRDYDPSRDYVCDRRELR